MHVVVDPLARCSILQSLLATPERAINESAAVVAASDGPSPGRSCCTRLARIPPTGSNAPNNVATSAPVTNNTLRFLRAQSAIAAPTAQNAMNGTTTMTGPHPMLTTTATMSRQAAVRSMNGRHRLIRPPMPRLTRAAGPDLASPGESDGVRRLLCSFGGTARSRSTDYRRTARQRAGDPVSHRGDLARV